MEFKIKRLHASRDRFRGYHLFDDQNSLLLVAEYGMPWSGKPQTVRFGAPDGRAIATLQQTTAQAKSGTGRLQSTFVVVYQDAVYAILMAYYENGRSPYFLLEVDKLRWLAFAPEPDDETTPLLSLYDNFSGNVRFFNPAVLPATSQLVGGVYKTAEPFHLSVTLPPDTLRQPALVALALTFLMDAQVF